jgi:ABC-type transport system involved in multi-copper enzyme maturation permease subunit
VKKNSAVRGLILYFFYSSIENVITSLILTFICGIAVLITGVPAIFTMISIFGIVLLSCSFVICTTKDTASKWNKFQLTLPVKRNDVIAAKYLGHLVLLLAGLVIAGIFIVIGVVLYEIPIEDVKASALLIIPTCIGTSLLACALFYPIAYTIAANREEALALACIFGSGAISALILWIGNTLNFQDRINAVFCIGIAVLLFIVSYIITKKMYAKKDL